MIDTNEILKEFEGLNLESKILDIKDPCDGLVRGQRYFFIRCEELYGIQIFDLEVVILEEVKFFEVFEYCEFIKNGKLSDFLIDFINRNSKEILKVRPEAISLIRENKLNKIFT